MRTIFFLLLSVAAFGRDYAGIAVLVSKQNDEKLMSGIAIQASSCACDFTIPASAWYVDINKNTRSDAYVINPQPGQKVCFANGTRAVIEFHNINGAEGLPITFISCDGTTIKGNAGQHVVLFFNSSYIVVDGGPGHNIDITGGGHGLYFRDLSTNVKAARIRFHDLGYSGFEAKTDPTCDPKTWRGAFTLRSPEVDDCDFENILTGEAIYIGESHYNTTFPLSGCASGIKSAQEHDVIGARVTNCRFKNIGRDAIQIGASMDMQVTGNRIQNFGTTKEYGQGSGITWNPGSTGEVAYNIIDTGSGFGVLAQGRGSGKIHHNVVTNTGTTVDGGGVMLAAYAPIDASGYEVYNNTIIANRVGIEVYSANNIHDNIINVPVGATLIKKAGTAVISQVNNIQVTGDVAALKLDASYTPMPGSPAYRDAVDAGAVQSVKKVIEDGKITVEVTGDVTEVYITTTSGKRVKIK